jgi:hypothetical protein
MRTKLSGRRPQPLRPDAILEALARHQVDYLVIGGVAAALLGAGRPTYDLDLLLEDSDSNAERLAAALRELEARWRTGDEALPLTVTPRILRSAQRHFWHTKYGDVDTHWSVAGVDSYRDAASRSWKATIGGTQVSVVPLDILIAMKEAAGRPKDQLALIELYELRDMQSED